MWCGVRASDHELPCDAHGSDPSMWPKVARALVGTGLARGWHPGGGRLCRRQTQVRGGAAAVLSIGADGIGELARFERVHCCGRGNCMHGWLVTVHACSVTRRRRPSVRGRAQHILDPLR